MVLPPNLIYAEALTDAGTPCYQWGVTAGTRILDCTDHKPHAEAKDLDGVEGDTEKWKGYRFMDLHTGHNRNFDEESRTWSPV